MVAKKKLGLIVGGVIAVVIYFFVVSPFVQKPELSKPLLTEGQNVSSEHVEWIVNELGGYKLQPTAQIEVVVEGVKFTVTTKDGRVVSSLGEAPDPDIRITTTRGAFVRILSADDVNAEVVKLYNEGLISVELLKDEVTLALKGYKAIYDALQE